jgi:hypothetical protein
MLKLKPDICENGGHDEGIQFVNKCDNQDNIGISQGLGTIQWVTEGGNIYMTIKTRHGQTEQKTIPIKKITDFQSFMEERKEEPSMFDRLNSDFNMSPHEIFNPFILSSRFPQHTTDSGDEHESPSANHTLNDTMNDTMYDTLYGGRSSGGRLAKQKGGQPSKKQKSFKINKNRKKQTPHKRKKSPRQRSRTERIEKPYGNEIKAL